MANDAQEPDGKTPVRFVLPEGETQEAWLTSEELDALTAHSTDIAPKRRRVARRLLKPGTFVVSAAITAIMVPAITNQWHDRKEDTELKSQLVQRMSEAAAVAVSNVRFLSSRGTPEQHVADRLCAAPRPSGTPSKTRIERCQKARQDADFATAKTTTETRTNWRRTAAAHEAQVATYFHGRSDDWARYDGAMNEFLEMFVTCSDKTSGKATRLLEYLGQKAGDAKWSALFVKPGDPGCTQFRVGADAMDELTDDLLERRQALLQDLVTADTRGLSTTRGDLWRDVWWVLLLVVGGAIAYLVFVISEEGQPRRK